MDSWLVSRLVGWLFGWVVDIDFRLLGCRCGYRAMGSISAFVVLSGDGLPFCVPAVFMKRGWGIVFKEMCVTPDGLLKCCGKRVDYIYANL